MPTGSGLPAFPIKGFGTERARLGTLKKKSQKNVFFLLKMSTYLLRGFFFKVLDEIQKIVLPAVILKKKFSTPNFTKFLNP